MDRKRTAALNAHEVSVLIDLLESRPDLISGKLGGSYPNVAAVRMAWEEVASQLNILGSGVIRTGLEIKKKWIDLKYRTKRKASEISQATLQRGGGPPFAQKLSDVELKIMALIGRTCVEGVCGQEFDSTYVQLKVS
ncbi:Coiled-coil domain-containing protein-like protein, partial [Stegodyphus mimosarum]